MSESSTTAFEVPPSIEGCLEACGRCRTFVERILASGPITSQRAYDIVGLHLRHCLDHFICLFRGIGDGVVDYDARDCDTRLEHDPQRFLEALDAVVEQLHELDPVTIQQSLLVRQQAAPGGRALCVDTNLQRELVFLSSHTIHHIAIMRVLARTEGIDVPDRLGVAFSTACFEAARNRPSTRVARRRAPEVRPEV